jgi:hypothetical protein
MVYWEGRRSDIDQWNMVYWDGRRADIDQWNMVYWDGRRADIDQWNMVYWDGRRADIFSSFAFGSVKKRKVWCIARQTALGDGSQKYFYPQELHRNSLAQKREKLSVHQQLLIWQQLENAILQGKFKLLFTERTYQSIQFD